MSRMVELGWIWICVSIDYRKSPRSAWPAHISGGSAGGHLAALAALAIHGCNRDSKRLTRRAQAAAPHYGAYDFTKTENLHGLMLPFLEQFVMHTRYADNPELFMSASPISHGHGEAPPFFVLHRENDSLIPSAHAQAFCAALRQAGAPTVCYAETADAHHASDMVSTVRSRLAAAAVAEFLGVVYGRYVRSPVYYPTAPATHAG
jgi:acetyl esterase/lipase